MAGYQHLSCVLLKEQTRLNSAAISECHKNLFHAAAITIGTTPDSDFTEIRTGSGSTTYVASMPAPVPNGEAESHCKYSLESILGMPAIQGHGAHILVLTRSESPVSLDSLKVHLRNTAAVAKAHEALAVYCGAAGATHNADFYIDQAQRDEIPAAIVTGFSVARHAICPYLGVAPTWDA